MELSTTVLNSDEVFLLDTAKHVFLWRGAKVSGIKYEVARFFAIKMIEMEASEASSASKKHMQVKEIVDVSEGIEPDAFTRLMKETVQASIAPFFIMAPNILI